MIKPWFESVRITQDEDRLTEQECKCMFLWCSVERIQHGEEDDFKNRAPKTIVGLATGDKLWLLAPYEEIQAAWALWLDAASNIQSVFTNN